jgi:uncharacterized membrane protein
VNGYQWALALHVTSAFFFVGGAVIAATLSVLAWRRERPSEIAVLLGLARTAVIAVGIGIAGTLAFGLWLVHEAGYSYGAGWIAASLVLWVVQNAMGGVGGKREKRTRLLAEQLAASGDTPSPELHARLRDPLTVVLSWGSGVVLLVVLALMIWKPGG